MTKRDRNRRTLSVKAHVHDDADLIALCDKIPHGEKNERIKNAMRVGLGLPVPERVQRHNDLMPIIEDLRQKLAEIEYDLHESHTRPMSAVNPVAVEDLRDEMHTELGKIAEVLNFLNNRIQKILINPQSVHIAVDNSEVDTTRITAQAKAKIAGNLSKSKW